MATTENSSLSQCKRLLTRPVWAMLRSRSSFVI